MIGYNRTTSKEHLGLVDPTAAAMKYEHLVPLLVEPRTCFPHPSRQKVRQTGRIEGLVDKFAPRGQTEA